MGGRVASDDLMQPYALLLAQFSFEMACSTCTTVLITLQRCLMPLTPASALRAKVRLNDICSMGSCECLFPELAGSLVLRFPASTFTYANGAGKGFNTAKLVQNGLFDHFKVITHGVLLLCRLKNERANSATD